MRAEVEDEKIETKSLKGLKSTESSSWPVTPFTLLKVIWFIVNTKAIVYKSIDEQKIFHSHRNVTSECHSHELTLPVWLKRKTQVIFTKTTRRHWCIIFSRPANYTEKHVASCEDCFHTSQRQRHSDRCSVTANREAEMSHCTSPCWTWENAGSQGFFASGSTGGCCHQLRHSPAPPGSETGGLLGCTKHDSLTVWYVCIMSTPLWGHYRSM